eukprot:GILK01005007.1.p1 GENE.GILK01005007.1~~GILK01005007.1.p1  ORF type:complete len:491 (-),score=54.17 GILK01005007.1:172-1644(-)
MDSLSDALEDVCSRFIYNLPPEELSSFERLFFQMQEAHWFYEDFYHDQSKARGGRVLPSYNLKDFAHQLFQHAPFLQPYRPSFDEHFQNFRKYLSEVPVYGAIVLNPSLDKCLLVRSYKGSSWSFPRGKINKDEGEVACAIREMWEETGLDVSTLILEREFIERNFGEQKVKLFVVPGVSEDTKVETQTRKEIGKIEWHRIDDLPSKAGGAGASAAKSTGGGNKYWGVIPFIGALRKWITRRKSGKNSVPAVASTSSQLQFGRSHSAPHERPETREKRPHIDAQNGETFGGGLGGTGAWSVEDMYETNNRLYGVVSTFDMSHYSTKINAQTMKEAAEIADRVLARSNNGSNGFKSKGKGGGGFADRTPPKPKRYPSASAASPNRQVGTPTPTPTPTSINKNNNNSTATTSTSTATAARDNRMATNGLASHSQHVRFHSEPHTRPAAPASAARHSSMSTTSPALPHFGNFKFDHSSIMQTLNEVLDSSAGQ